MKRASSICLLLIAVVMSALLGAGPEGALAAPARQYTDARWLIENPCRSWQLEDGGSYQPQVICSGVFDGDRARINVPAPTVHAQLPEFGIVDLPLIVQLGWTPGTFAYSDSARRTIEWSRNRIEGYRIELSLSPHPGTATVQSSVAQKGNLAANSLDPRLDLFSRDQYPALCAASSLDDLPANLGGLELCPASSVDAQLPGGLVTGPSGDMLPRYNWTGGNPFRGGWIAGWSEWASVTGSGSVNGSPAYRVAFTTGWALFARVQWDYHWRERTRTEKHCGWEYYGEPGWYWDWDEWPPICIDVTITYWQRLCPPNNPQPGCPTITYGMGPDWWQYIDSLEASTIHRGEDGFGGYLDLIVLQSQPLLTGP